MTSFAFFIGGSSLYSDAELGSYSGSLQIYNYLKGKLWDGSPIIDPNTGKAVKYALSGDPVNKTGWHEGEGWPGGVSAGDRRMMMSAGPFTLSPGDTQEVTFAIIMARGTDNINSITELRNASKQVQTFFNQNASGANSDFISTFKVLDPGTGYSLLAKWNKVNDPNLDHYKIQIGASSGDYYNTFTTTDTSYTFTNLLMVPYILLGYL